MSWEFETASIITVQLTASVIGLIQTRFLDKASKLLVFYLALSLVFESLATYHAVQYNNNLAILNRFAPLEFILISLYFGSIISQLSRRIMLFIIAITVIIWLITNQWYPYQDAYNTGFLIYESIGTIALCLYYYLDVLSTDDARGIGPSFWFVAFLLIFWSFTFFYWLLGFALQNNLGEDGKWMGTMLWVINLVCYAGFGIVFLFYRKLNTVD